MGAAVKKGQHFRAALPPGTGPTGRPEGATAHGAPPRLITRLAQGAAFLVSARPAATLVVALALTIASWPVTSVVPLAGLDPSWAAGLAMAFHQNLHWGPQVDFTYGPLGFLTVTSDYYQGTALLSFLFVLFSHWAFYALLWPTVRLKFPGYWGLVVTYLVGTTVVLLAGLADLLMGVALLLGVSAIRPGRPRTTGWAVAGLGAVAGFGLLLKFSIGLLALGVAVVAVASQRGWPRRALLAMVSFGAVLLGAWAATGNPVSNLWLFLRMSAAVASGYAGAMSYESGRVHEWLYAGIVLACFLGCLAFGLRPRPRREQVCAALMFLGFAWTALKEGFVRHDAHDLEFFGLMLVAFLAIPWPAPALRAPRWRGRLPVVACLGASLLLAWKAVGNLPPNPLHVPAKVQDLGSEMMTALSSGRSTGAVSAARDSLQEGYALPGWVTGRLRGHTVAIEPWENEVAWAYPGFRWDPEPVLQQYSAYETSLDDLDASFLRSRSAPKFILVQPTSSYIASFGDPFFGAPATVLARLCHYAQLGTTAKWQVLRRVPDRCGSLHFLRSANVAFGRNVAVPSAPPGYAVVATFGGVGTSLLYRAENVVFKAQWVRMFTPSTSYRFIAGTAADLHLLRLPSTLGYSRPFSPRGVNAFSLVERDLSSDNGSYRVTFYSLRVSPVT